MPVVAFVACAADADAAEDENGSELLLQAVAVE